MVFYNARKDGRTVLRLFAVFVRASGLGLNCTESIVSPLWPEDHPNFALLASNVLKIFRGFKIKYAAKYLGIMMGLNAWVDPWAEVIIQFRHVAIKLRSFGLGLLACLRIYNMQVFTSHIAQFYSPSTSILSVENKSVQLLFAGPNNAVTQGFLKNLKSIEFRVQANSLSIVALAAKIRVVHRTSKTFLRNSAAFSDFMDSDERILGVRVITQKFLDNNIMSALENAKDIASTNKLDDSEMTQDKHYQAKVTK
jgi:hypothetical protein